jgi:hypothetical protein
VKLTKNQDYVNRHGKKCQKMGKFGGNLGKMTKYYFFSNWQDLAGFTYSSGKVCLLVGT